MNLHINHLLIYQLMNLYVLRLIDFITFLSMLYFQDNYQKYPNSFNKQYHLNHIYNSYFYLSFILYIFHI